MHAHKPTKAELWALGVLVAFVAAVIAALLYGKPEWPSPSMPPLPPEEVEEDSFLSAEEMQAMLEAAPPVEHSLSAEEMYAALEAAPPDEHSLSAEEMQAMLESR